MYLYQLLLHPLAPLLLQQRVHRVAEGLHQVVQLVAYPLQLVPLHQPTHPQRHGWKLLRILLAAIFFPSLRHKVVSAA